MQQAESPPGEGKPHRRRAAGGTGLTRKPFPFADPTAAPGTPLSNIMPGGCGRPGGPVRPHVFFDR